MKKLLLLFAVMLSAVGAWAQPNVGIEYRIKDVSRSKYLTIRSYEGNSNGEYGTVPVLEKTEGNSNQVWVLETASEGKYYFKSRSGYYLTLRGWCVDATSAGKNEISIEAAGDDVFYLKNGTKYFKVEDIRSDDGTAHPFCDAPSGHVNIVKWAFEEVPSSEEFERIITVTYNYYIGERLYTTQTKEQRENSVPDAPAVDYVTIVGYEGTVGDSDCEITVNCKENLPFVSSASYGEATWQVIDIHSNMENRTWKFVAEDVNVETPDVAKSQNASLGDEYYWAFVGDLVDGFKIYNKAAGASLTLRKAENGNKPSVMSATDDRNIFKLHKSTSSISNSFCFKIDGDTHYVNKQNQTLQGWTAKDEGSSCRIFTPASFVLNTLGGFESAPSGAVGSYSYLADAEKYATFAPVIAAVKADQYDIEALEALDELNMVADIVASEKVAMAEGYYFIKGTGIGNNANWYITYDGTNCKAKNIGDNEKLAPQHVWSVEAVDGQAGGYKFRSCNLDKYLKISAAPAASPITSDFNEGDIFKLNANGPAKYIIKDGNNFTMRTENSGVINEWHGGEDNESWYIIPATELDIEVTSAGWATTCLPFDVVLPEELTAYALTDVSGVNGEETGSVSLISKAGIKAYEGALLKGSAGTYTLSIEETASNRDANLLSGTTVAKDMSTVTGDVYLLTSDGAGSAQLSKLALATSPTDAQKTLAANKAYLNIDPSATRYFVFNFGDDTETAIEGIEAENTADAVVYDLAGRRVQKAQKGLYIVNGKKVIK